MPRVIVQLAARSQRRAKGATAPRPAAGGAARRCGWRRAQPQPAATQSSWRRRSRLTKRHRSAPALAAWAACRAARATGTSAAAATRCWSAVARRRAMASPGRAAPDSKGRQGSESLGERSSRPPHPTVRRHARRGATPGAQRGARPRTDQGSQHGSGQA
eukprot:scaffold89228_cov68-Phaeocystis_antarctica.AAC.7